MATGSTTARGSLQIQVHRAHPAVTLDVAREFGLPRPGQPREVREWKQANEEHLYRGIRDLENIERGRGPVFMGALWAEVLYRDQTVNLGLISARVVTTAGVNFMRDAFLNTTELENMKFHGMGTGTTAEATSDTALVTELTTAYATDNTRPTGTLVSGGTGIFQTVATVTVDASVAATEHGIFSQAATGGGTLLDRSVFAVVNLASTEAIQFTYNLTMPAGG